MLTFKIDQQDNIILTIPTPAKMTELISGFSVPELAMANEDESDLPGSSEPTLPLPGPSESTLPLPGSSEPTLPLSGPGPSNEKGISFDYCND
jgi:hypothetical protein